MSIVVTGATGQPGRLVVEALLQRGVPAEQAIATGRRTAVLGDLAERGVVVRRADLNDEASLPGAFAGAHKLLLVSGSEAGQRVRQHASAVNAAKAAGVRSIAYTSGIRANTSTLLANQDHRATERLLAHAGVPHALLRNCWYLENYTGQLPVYLERGIVGPGAVRVHRGRVRRPPARLGLHDPAHHAAHRAQTRRSTRLRRHPAGGPSSAPSPGSPRTAAWPATTNATPRSPRP